MHGTLILLLSLALFGLLAGGTWVAITLFATAIFGMWLNDNGNIGMILATTTWGASSSWTLVALPMFIWMGEILFRTRL